MRIGLVHIDGKWPNLALMKLSAWHKAHGNEVTLYRPGDILRGQDLFAPADKLYGAVVFNQEVSPTSRKLANLLAAQGVEIGGTGWSLEKTLPPEIEATPPDYDLYGVDYGFGFTSRGCIRNCQFCVVPVKEGHIRHVAWPDDIANPRSQILYLFDNNFLADPLWREKCEQIISRGYKVDFTQGLDIRLVTEEATEYLAAMKYRKRIHFAFDHVDLEQEVRAGIELLLSKGFNHDRLSFYVLVNYNSTIDEDLRRIAILDEYGVNPFVMVYKKHKAPKIIRDLATWCNKYQLHKSCKFEDLDRKNHRKKAG